MTRLGVMLTALYAILKFTETIDWTWFAVVLPAIIGIGLDLILTVFFLVFGVRFLHRKRK